MAAGGEKAFRPPRDEDWANYAARYERGEHRAGVFCHMVLDDMRRAGPGLTLLEIGCGRGIETDVRLQESLAQAAGRVIGIEPDPAIAVALYFSEFHRCTLEEAPLAPASIDIAIATFVLEHVSDPARFWQRLHAALVEGGVFWGITIDGRHPFAACSNLAQRVGLKKRLLRWVRRGSQADEVETYPTFYRANAPATIRRQTALFRSAQFLNVNQIGQFDAYLPKWLRGLGRGLDRLGRAFHLPGPILIIRLQK